MLSVILLVPFTGFGATNWIYEDALASGWQDWSYNATRNFSNADPVYTGTYSLSVSITDDWGALSLHHDGVAVTNYTALTFVIRAIQDHPDLQLVCRNGDTRFTDLFVTNYISGLVESNAWKRVTIPLSDFEITNSTITRLDWQGRDGSARPGFYLDQVGLISQASLSVVAAHVQRSDRVVVYFDDVLDLASASNGIYRLQNDDDTNYATAVTGTYAGYLSDLYALSIQFSHALITNGIYTLSVGNITNLSGNAAITTTTNFLQLVAYSVDMAFSNEHRISPYIYGVNLAPDQNYLSGAGFTVNRRSGNDNSCYNWKLETSNRAEDGWYQNFHWDTNTLTNSLEQTALMNSRAGAATFWTLPMQEWVARDNHSYSFSVAEYGPQEFANGDMGNGYKTNGTDRITNNAPTDAYVPARAFAGVGDAVDTIYMDEWFLHLQDQFGAMTDDLFPFVSLDNEIDIWYDVHHDTWRTEMSYDVIKEKFITYSSMVHSNVPGLNVFGPVSTSWWFYWNSDAGTNDKAIHGGTDFLEWFLQEMKAYEDLYGQRLLDVLDIHYYPAKPLIFNNDSDTNTRAIRLAEVDSFWNTNYIDAWDGISNNPWATATQPNNDKPYIIPRFKALIASNYPGTKFAISEWQMGGDDDISGGLAVADGLGVFGREDLFMACYWRWGTDMSTESAAYNAFKLFGNYDDNGSRFAPISIQAVASDTVNFSVYASRSEEGTRLTTVCVNKDPARDFMVDLNFSGFIPHATAQVVRLSAMAPDRIVSVEPNTNAATTTSIVIPAYSATLIEFTADAIDHDNDGMPTPWENLYTNATDAGATPLDPYSIDDQFDYDGDGILNIDEYRALTDPTASNAAFRVYLDDSSFSHLLTCEGAVDMKYECLSSDSLVTPMSNWTSLGEISGTGLMLLWTNTTLNEKEFYRIKAQ